MTEQAKRVDSHSHAVTTFASIGNWVPISALVKGTPLKPRRCVVSDFEMSERGAVDIVTAVRRRWNLSHLWTGIMLDGAGIVYSITSHEGARSNNQLKGREKRGCTTTHPLVVVGHWSKNRKMIDIDINMTYN